MPTALQSLEASLAALDAPRVRQPVAKSTPEQMAAARAAAYATVRHDGLMAGERLVNGEVYVFNADSREAEQKQMPTHGQVVTFSKVPAGSYCSTGVAYRVDRKGNKGAYRFENVARGSATYDQPWAVKSAVWSDVAA